ncbi:hypothetical protein RPE78_10280 [Thioclava litoralis]|uniref:Uncharacterized protein n=1 Tax=Thioclava litoralis TaxID=3076557 RepID=A0ABZ1DWD2_9RHOB|nr:hypothetical protein RPE78_10280 [Thioclava sp. FTW29]
MLRITFLLASLFFAQSAAAGGTSCKDYLGDSPDCKRVHIAKRHQLVDRVIEKDGVTSRLMIESFALVPNFDDGLDPATKAYLILRHEMDGQETAALVKEVGNFVSFYSATRVAAGIYDFKGEIFRWERGCMDEIVYRVDAAKAIILARKGQLDSAALSSEISIRQRFNDLCF